MVIVNLSDKLVEWREKLEAAQNESEGVALLDALDTFSLQMSLSDFQQAVAKLRSHQQEAESKPELASAYSAILGYLPNL